MRLGLGWLRSGHDCGGCRSGVGGRGPRRGERRREPSCDVSCGSCVWSTTGACVMCLCVSICTLYGVCRECLEFRQVYAWSGDTRRGCKNHKREGEHLDLECLVSEVVPLGPQSWLSPATHTATRITWSIHYCTVAGLPTGNSPISGRHSPTLRECTPHPQTPPPKQTPLFSAFGWTIQWVFTSCSIASEALFVRSLLPLSLCIRLVPRVTCALCTCPLSSRWRPHGSRLRM